MDKPHPKRNAHPDCGCCKVCNVRTKRARTIPPSHPDCDWCNYVKSQTKAYKLSLSPTE